ncbi:MAG: hypothetical protein A2993_02510 [Gammaproteobacteria bacterium RIFCSPLOWO2_01_FULL_47_190]|nr:MAG: hypothetical protein A2993_02510 [Gammaproteobacteria bacterium RIFCSPLOWO2_01_FULL_47_190]
MKRQEPVVKRLIQETAQGHAVRKELYSKLEKLFGEQKRVVAFFTSFRFPVVLQDEDVDMLEEVLINTELENKELVLILNSPGGDALAAERVVNVCRTYCTKGFSVMVPRMAKSAATMICLGANEIIMSSTSELGPIDPQILIRDEQGKPVRYQAAHEIIDSYNELMDMANITKGRLEPFLQQLKRFDARDISNIKSAQALSESIAVNLLKTGCMNRLTEVQIKRKIKILTDPKKTKDHGRPVFADTAKKCGLNVKVIKNKDDLWKSVWELYIRMNYLTSNTVGKIIESYEESYHALP